MRMMLVACAVMSTTACTIERIGPPGVTLTRAVAVKPRNVAVYTEPQLVPGPFSVVEEIFVEDDGEVSPRELEDHLRVKAGALGANAIVLHPLNRRPNGTRLKLGISLDDPFKYYRATALYMGEGPRPQFDLGTLGGAARAGGAK